MRLVFYDDEGDAAKAFAEMDILNRRYYFSSRFATKLPWERRRKPCLFALTKANNRQRCVGVTIISSTRLTTYILLH